MRSPNHVMPIFPDDDRDDAIRWVRLARVSWPKDRKCVRGEDRQYDHRYRERFVRFHKKRSSCVESVSTRHPEDFPMLLKGIFRLPLWG